MSTTLILGGARSGKSAHAEQLATGSGLPVVVAATAEALDDEMRARIARHRRERPASWTVREVPLALTDVLDEMAEGPACCVLVDCLTLWLSNQLHGAAGSDPEATREVMNALVDRVARWPEASRLLLVSNEVGQGIVPLGALTRRFVDESGRLNQALARVCSRVVLVTAGLPLTLKGG